MYLDETNWQCSSKYFMSYNCTEQQNQTKTLPVQKLFSLVCKLVSELFNTMQQTEIFAKFSYIQGCIQKFQDSTC